MNDEIRVGSRPVQRNDEDDGSSRGGGSKAPWIILVVVVVLLVVGFLFRDKFMPKSDEAVDSKSTGMTKSSGYQAVFLTNGQVYFGKIANVGQDYVSLKDIYYLQVTQPPLQGSQQQGQAQPQQQPQISLVKLGNELHGPQDEMHINREQILFYEDMKEDSKVTTAIREYQKNPPASTGAQPKAPVAAPTPALTPAPAN